LKYKSPYGLILLLLVSACVSSITPAETNKTGVVMAASITPIITRAPAKEQILPKSPTRTVIAAATAITTYAYIPQITYTPAPAPSQNIIADHTSVSAFSRIPQSAVTSAAAKKVLFMHQSTGGLIDDSGLGCLAGLHGDINYGYPQECVTYAQNLANNSWPWYDKSNWNWDMFVPEANAISKTDQFVNIVHSVAGNYDFIGMKYCYVDGWNQSDNVDQQYYINAMLSLESQYPGKTFIWATSALWNEPGSACGSLFNSCAGISAFNEQVRAYAKAHNKPLFDIADIESHDQNGTPCTVQGYEGMCSVWYDSGGGHPNIAGSIRLAKGFWWLMARLNGWNGQ
jgi:hypothetical protein